MNITVYVRVKKITRFYARAIAEYEKRLGRYCKFSLQTNKKPKDANASHGILICADGNGLSSEELAEKIQTLSLASVSDIRIAIGWAEDGAFDGWEKLRLSGMELGPELEAVIMTEQLYRAYRILHHEPYHF